MTHVGNTVTFSLLSESAAETGVEILAFTSSEELKIDGERLSRWQEQGYMGELDYMKRGRELLAHPRAIAPNARSVVSVGVFYDSGSPPARLSGTGRVARYAWGRDYHRVLRKVLERFCAAVRTRLGHDFEYRLFSDSVPLLERALASRAGLGFVGRNTMLIVPGKGSFLFLGEVLWSLDVHGGASHERTFECGSCRNCIERCPTEAILGDRILDARRCISYLTIEKRGALSPAERTMIGEWVFGCDVCQDVCPFNYTSIKKRRPADLRELSRESGAGPLLDLKGLFELQTNEQFSARFAGTALMRTKREGLLRNAACVAANTDAAELLPTLLAASREDPSAIVRRHSLWAAWKLSRGAGEARTSLLRARDTALADPCEDVRAEAAAIEA